MTIPDLTVQCAWCKTIAHVGDPKLPTSHAMCESCCNRWHKEMDAIEAGK